MGKHPGSIISKRTSNAHSLSFAKDQGWIQGLYYHKQPIKQQQKSKIE